MDNTFANDEKLYRAVYPASYSQMYWKKDGSLSSAAFRDPDGLSVERGNFRSDQNVIKEMQGFFKGCIVSVTAEQCYATNASIQYKPTRRSIYHSEIHGNENTLVLSASQRKHLASVAQIEYFEK